MSTFRTALVSAALCALFAAAPAAAKDELDATRSFEWSELRSGLGFRAAASALRPESGVMRLQAVSGRAMSRRFGGMRIWAGGSGFAVGRRSAGYGLQGGAAWALDESIDLTASYRMMGYALGNRLDPQLGDVAMRAGAPFLGLDIRF